MRCQATTKKGTQHNSQGGITIEHGDHAHVVCKMHVSATEFINCSTAHKTQYQLPMGIICGTCERHFDTAEEYHSHVAQAHPYHKGAKQYTVFFTGLVAGATKPLENVVKLWVINSNTITAKSIEEVMANPIVTDATDPLSLRYLLVRDSEGNKFCFKQQDMGNEEGYKNGMWKWTQIHTTAEIMLLKTPNICVKCHGTGEVSYGVNHILKHGMNRRGCFECRGIGTVK